MTVKSIDWARFFKAYWDEFEDLPPVEIPSMQVDDVEMAQPVGFIWTYKPRYRVKAAMRKWDG